MNFKVEFLYFRRKWIEAVSERTPSFSSVAEEGWTGVRSKVVRETFHNDRVRAWTTGPELLFDISSNDQNQHRC